MLKFLFMCPCCFDKIGAFFGDHQCGGGRMCRRNIWKSKNVHEMFKNNHFSIQNNANKWHLHAGIDYPQIVYAMHTKLCVNNGGAIK